MGQTKRQKRDGMSNTMRIDLIPDVSAGRRNQRTQFILEDLLEDHPVRRQDGGAYEALLDSIYDAVLVTNSNGTILETNVRAVRLFNTEHAAIQGCKITDFIAEAPERLVDSVRKHLAEKRFVVIQAYAMRQDQSIFPCEIVANSLPIFEGRLCFYFRDVTIRRQTEEMLLTEHTAIQNAASGIAVVNADLEMEYINPALALMWHYDSDKDARGSPLSCLFGGNEDIARQVYNSVSEDMPKSTIETQALRKDDTTFDVQVSVGCNLNTDGQKVGVVLSLQDLSDQRLAEKAQQESERTRVMLESLGAACHYLGQPATILQGNLELLHQKLTGSELGLDDMLTSCQSAMERLVEVLNRLNRVNKYRTTPYLDTQTNDSTKNSERIIEI